jgi:hypothetical protein
MLTTGATKDELVDVLRELHGVIEDATPKGGSSFRLSTKGRTQPRAAPEVCEYR